MQHTHSCTCSLCWHIPTNVASSRTNWNLLFKISVWRCKRGAYWIARHLSDASVPRWTLWAEAYVCLYRSHLWIVQIRKKDPLYTRFLNLNRLFFFFFLQAVIQWCRLQDEVSGVDFIEERRWRSTEDKEINRLTDNRWKTPLYFHVCSKLANSNVLNWVNKYILRWYSLIDMLSVPPTSQEAWEAFFFFFKSRRKMSEGRSSAEW